MPMRRLLGSRWIRTLTGVLLLAFLLWFCGPLLGLGAVHPFDSPLSRILAILALLVFWLVFNLVAELRARHKDAALVDGVTAAAPDADATATAEELAALRERLRDALHTLRLGKGARRGGWGRRRLYELPWYMLIGPPGAGKTTALLHSGLRFPLADGGAGAAAIQGIGGTRNCDWWFTDDAVLLDTAGRYTTQDSAAAVDSAAWLGFLRLLKHVRRRQPLNGVIVAISLADLSLPDEAQRLAHARAVRRRIRELHDELGVRLPVYVLFTKADLIAGFSEFFEALGREEREQVWGMTFPLDGGTDENGAVGGFDAGFDRLLARLNEQLIERLQAEQDLQRRRLIHGFPSQVASLRDVASSFLGEIFRPSRLETRPLLRGVYLASGTQDGTPIDRLLGAMAGQFGLPRSEITAFSGTGRSYFLQRLLREVVFAEAALVSADPRVERRARLTHLAVAAGCGLLLLLALGGWTVSWFGNRAVIAAVHDSAERYRGQYATLLARGAADTDFVAVLPPLATLRGMPGGYDAHEQSTPIAMTFGLSQGRKLGHAAIDSYYRGLDALLLPRLLARLETQMRDNMDKPDFLYEALKVYLILGRQGPLDRDLVGRWMDADFAATLPGDDAVPIRDALDGHVEALLQRPLPAVPLDGPLVAAARTVLTRQPLAEYVYNRMIHSRHIASLPDWTVAENAGPAAARVFQRRSGTGLGGGIPGIYTWSGYHEVFLRLLPTVTQSVAEDGWVLGRTDPGGVAGTLAEATRLRRDVLGLYLDDYTRRWDGLLGDIGLKPFTNLQGGLDELNTLSAPDSPLRDFLQAADAQTQLSRPAASEQAAGRAENRAAKIGGKVSGLATLQARSGMTIGQNELVSILGDTLGGGGTAAAAPVDPTTRVDAHFRWLHDFVAGKDGGAPPMETALTRIQAIYAGFAQVANAPNQGQALLSVVAGGGGGGGGSPATQLAALADGLPKPLAVMLHAVASSSMAVTAGGASQELNGTWRSKVLPLCQEAFNRFPFIAGSQDDVPVDDFARLLGPGGLIDSFFNDNLKPFVDTSTTPWRWQAADQTRLQLSPATLVQFERAALIRDSLFGSGGAMQVRFSLTPDALDPRVSQITADIGGTVMTYAHGPTESTSFQWPGANGRTLVRVTMTTGSGGDTVVESDGPWALLRLLDQARVIPSGQPDRFELVFGSPQGEARFQLRASSVRNPFTLSALRAFRCPSSL